MIKRHLFFSVCANASLHQAGLKGQRGGRALQRLVLHIRSATARGPHSHLTACHRRLSRQLFLCSPVLTKFSTVLTKPKGDLDKKKTPTKWNPFERFWTESVWNKINISSHSQITKTVSIKRAVYVLICSEDSVPELAPFEVKGKAPAVFMMPRFLTELKNNMVIGFLSSE